MSQDNNTPQGAPSEDTTSALFVSARKKQLEQQEAERLAKEKEDQRLAAEAEVQRLEAEVEERRRRAEQEAMRVEAEAAEKRRQADEEARRMAANPGYTMQTGVPPGAPYGPQSGQTGVGNPQAPVYPQTPGNYSAPAVQPQTKSGGAATGLFANKKLLAIIGGGVLVVIAIVIILVLTLGRGGESVDIGGSSDTGGRVDRPITYDITGYYYFLNGDMESDSFYFYSDGTMDFYYYARSETTTHDYSVDGDEIVIYGAYNIDRYKVTIVDEYSLVDEYGDTYSRITSYNTPSAPTYYNWDISGKYLYLNGDTDNDYLYFYSDGTMEIFYSSSGDTDTWDYGYDEGQVTVFGSLYGVDSPYVFAIIDEDTLLDRFNDYYMNVQYSGGDASAWSIDPQTPLNAVADVSIANMGVRYPSDIFYVGENTSDLVELRTYDPNGGVIIVKLLSPLVYDQLYANIIGPIINSVGQNLIQTTFSQYGEYWIEYENTFDSTATESTPIRYTAKVHCEVDGVPAIGAIHITVWNVLENAERTNQYYLKAMIMIVNEEVTAEYGTLFWRIVDATFDS